MKDSDKILLRKLCPYLVAGFSLLFGQPVWGQSLTALEKYGDEKLNAQDYNLAVGAYQRVLFFHEGEEKTDLLIKLAGAYDGLENYDESAKYFRLAALSANNDSLRLEMLFNRTYALIQTGRYDLAQLETFNLPDSLTGYFLGKAAFYRAVVHFFKNEYDQSREQFALSLEVADKEDKVGPVNILFEDLARMEKRFKPGKIRMMSIFLPGLGQAYCGNVKDGLNSLLVTSAFMALFVRVAFTVSIIDGFISVMPWYHRYYTGGFKNAYTMAEEKINEGKSEVFDELLQLYQ